MSMFTGSQNPVITGGSFIAAQSIQVNNDWEKEKYAIQTLEQHVAFGAFHNSKDRYDAPKCLPRTREAVFREISEWIHVTSSWKPILWLYGPAGAGKSAIAQSVAEKADELGCLLLGTYFFNRSDGLRNNAARLIPSLAYQMTQSVPCTRQYVFSSIIEGSGVFTLSFGVQIKRLILQPLISSGVIHQRFSNANFRPMLIIIDGLDECQNSNERTGFIQALMESFRKSLFPIIVLCHSRSESDIRATFNHPDSLKISARLVLDNKFKPDSDIQTFLDHHFAEIKRTHLLKLQIPHDWPSQEVIEELVRKSSGQFIYASTVVKHVASRKHNPIKRLMVVLSVGSGSDASPFRELDALYQLVLSVVEEEDCTTLIRIIGMICFSPTPPLKWPPPAGSILQHEFGVVSLTFPTPATIDQAMNLEAGKTLLILDELHSLIDVRGPTNRLRAFHASLSDFLRDRSRSEMFYIDAGLPPADHALAYFMLVLSASTAPRNFIVKICPPSRDYFAEASLTAELLEFFENFPWEHVLKENVPSGSLLSIYYHGQSTFELLWIWHICELYTFCKMASKKSLVWATVYKRALRGFVAWVDHEMTPPKNPSPSLLSTTCGEVLQHYMARLLNFLSGSTRSNSELFDMVLDVLRTPGLSCTHHISATHHNSMLLKTLLEALVLNRFPHTELTVSSSCHCLSVFVGGKVCCQKSRADVTSLIDLSNRTSYLDALLPYTGIETEVCRPEWIPGKGHKKTLEDLKAAISRYKKKPPPHYYNYNSGWDADIPSLRAAAVMRAHQFSGDWSLCRSL